MYESASRPKQEGDYTRTLKLAKHLTLAAIQIENWPLILFTIEGINDSVRNAIVSLFPYFRDD
jgi:hypothetical protein